MIYNIDNISLFANHFHRSKKPDVLKLKRDPNRHSFIQENGDLYQIEIDAFTAKLVLSAVDRYFDQRVYDDLMTEFTPQEIEELLKQVQFNDGGP